MGLEQTTTWAVATVCTIFVVASLLVEAGINQLGKWLKKKKNMKPLVQTLEKIKDGALIDHVLLTHPYFLHLWLQNYGEGIDHPVSVTLN
jgi:hypothetical protein